MDKWEHGTLTVGQTIGLVTANGTQDIDQENGDPRRVMAALDRLTDEGWVVVGTVGSSYLLRRPRPTTYRISDFTS